MSSEPTAEAICAEECTSGCHATDCEHHGHLAAASEEPRPRSDVDRERLATALVKSDLMARYSEYAHKANPETMAFEPLEELAETWADAVLAALPSPRSDDRRVDMFATTLQETGRLTVHPGDEQAALAALRVLGIDTFEVAAPRSDDREGTLREAAKRLVEVQGHQFDGYFSNSRSPDENGNRSAHSRFIQAQYEAIDAVAAALHSAPDTEPDR